MTKVLILDSYDSFTFNLVHYFEALDCEVTVLKNDQPFEHFLDQFTHVVLSPGPGLPQQAGFLMEIIRKLKPETRVLGICLGLQALCIHFGGTLKNLPNVHHGYADELTQIKTNRLFAALPKKFKVARYHSWAADEETLPVTLIATAQTNDRCIMAFAHVSRPIFGVQFHPESILTEHGLQILKNFIDLN